MHQTVNLAGLALRGFESLSAQSGDVSAGSSPYDENDWHCGMRPDAGVAQLVELQPSKLDVAGSSPVARCVAGVAPLL